MSRIADRSCWCCGERYGTGCVIGPSCICGFDECSICRKCYEHCACSVEVLTEKMEALAGLKQYVLAGEFQKRIEKRNAQRSADSDKKLPNEIWTRGGPFLPGERS